MSNETIFGKVFVGGGKTIGHLPTKVISILEGYMERGEHIIVGDAHGCDLAFQMYLHSKGYPNVTVYCSGKKCRHNIGSWEEKHIDVPESVEGYEFYKVKDHAMINDCDCAMLVWNRKSFATRMYIYHLKELGKPVFTFNEESDCFKISRRRGAKK